MKSYKKRICILSANEFKKNSGGAVQRYFNFENYFKEKGYRVFLLSEKLYSIEKNKFTFLRKLKKAVKENDIFLIQPDILFYYYEYLKNKFLIIDLICPFHLEHKEKLKLEKKENNNDEMSLLNFMFKFSLEKGDVFICGNEEQKKYYSKFLKSINLSSKKNLLHIIPYGINEQVCKTHDKKDFFKNFTILKKDFVFLWLGGIWGWYDPLTLLKGFKILLKNHPNCKILFAVGKVSNESTSLINECENFISKNNMYNNIIFYKKNINYNDLNSLLNKCHAGVVSFKSTNESKLSCRIRYMDLLQNNLPIIISKSDPFQKKIENNKIGIIAESQSPKSWFYAMNKILNKSYYDNLKLNVKKFKQLLCSKNILLPLKTILENIKKNHCDSIEKRSNNNDINKKYNNKKIVIFGTGKAGLRTALKLLTNKITPFYFVDNNNLMWDSYIENIPVYSPLKLQKLSPEIIIIASFPGRESIKQQIMSLKLPKKIKVIWFGNI